MKRHTHASSVSPISYSRLLIRKLTSPFFPAVGTMKTPMNDCDDRGCYNYELKKIFNLARLLNPNGLWNKSVHPFDDMRYKQLFQDEIGECGAHPVALQSPDGLAQLVVSERHDYRPAAAVRPTPPHKRQRREFFQSSQVTQRASSSRQRTFSSQRAMTIKGLAVYKSPSLPPCPLPFAAPHPAPAAPGTTL